MLITGAGGMLGQDLLAGAAAAGLDVTGLTRAELDITDRAAVVDAVAAHAPGVVVNCAAWTDVDGAEVHPAAAAEVNGGGAGNLAHAAAARGAWIIHVSSDYVFDGTQRQPYVESDATAPLSAYGASKLAGEEAVAEAAPSAHTIVRSSWLFGRHGPCFPATILRLAAERDELNVVDDQVGSPTYTGHLAALLTRLAAGSPPPGILHRSGTGACSWFEFAQQIVRHGGADCEVRPVPSTQMPRPAQRPSYSVLGTERPDAAPQLPQWQQGLEEFMAERVSA